MKESGNNGVYISSLLRDGVGQVEREAHIFVIDIKGDCVLLSRVGAIKTPRMFKTISIKLDNLDESGDYSRVSEYLKDIIGVDTMKDTKKLVKVRTETDILEEKERYYYICEGVSSKRNKPKNTDRIEWVKLDDILTNGKALLISGQNYEFMRALEYYMRLRYLAQEDEQRVINSENSRQL